MTETFIKERKHNLTGKVEPVGIDDASAFLCRFENGSLATFEATRYARGHKALYTLEINGEHASVAWDLHDLHRAAVLRSSRRGAAARLAEHPHHRRRPSLHEALVGARAADRLRAHVHPPVRRLPRGARRRHGAPSPRSAAAWRPIWSPMRCCAPQKPAVGNGRTVTFKTLADRASARYGGTSEHPSFIKGGIMRLRLLAPSPVSSCSSVFSRFPLTRSHRPAPPG